MNGNLYSQNNMSQVDTVLFHLITKGSISPDEGNKLYGIKYLSKCISRLKEKDINIESIFCDSEKRLDSKIDKYILCREQSTKVRNMINMCKANALRKIA